MGAGILIIADHVSVHMGHSPGVAYYYYVQKALFNEDEKTKIRGILGDIYLPDG
jgi:hypothetical protein